MRSTEDKKLYNKQYREKNKDKLKKRFREYYLNNKEKFIKDALEWKRKNPEKYKLVGKKFREKNKEKLKEYHKKYAKKNAAKLNAKNMKRIATKLSQTPEWADLKAIEEFYKNCPKGYEVDHIIPLNGKNVRGLHILENLQYLTISENRTKGNKY